MDSELNKNNTQTMTDPIKDPSKVYFDTMLNFEYQRKRKSRNSKYSRSNVKSGKLCYSDKI